ncbi:unnamed protein product [Musa acuminata subsp. burmannicoides]
MGHMNRNQDIGIGLCSLWDGQVRWKPRKQVEQAYDRSSIGWAPTIGSLPLVQDATLQMKKSWGLLRCCQWRTSYSS